MTPAPNRDRSATPLVAAEQRPAEPAADPASALVELRDLHVEFTLKRNRLRGDREVVKAVDGVNLSIARGQTLGLVGGTGSGKSTVAHVVMGMVTPTAGSLLIDGEEQAGLSRRQRRGRRNRVQVVLQDPYSSLDPRMRVGHIIAEPLVAERRHSGSEIRVRVSELLHLVGLPPGSATLYPHEFSGGQRQRIAISRALASDPDVVVLDEPTSALDVSVRAQILTLLKDIQDRLGITYLVISHDLMSVAYLATTVAVMNHGRIVEVGPTEQLYRSPHHPYTALLLASAPSTGGSFLDAIDAGLVPPRDPQVDQVAGGGCRYRANCALRAHLGDPATCAEDEPVLEPAAEGQLAACHFADRIAELTAR